MDNNTVLEMEACKFCDRLVPSTSLLTHTAHCEREVRRSGGLEQCPMCDAEIPKKRLQRHIDNEHVNDNCPECHKLFERRLIKHHVETECQMRGVTCTFCDMSLLARDLEKHMVHCGTRSEKCTECGETIMLKYKTIHLESNHGFIQLDDVGTERSQPTIPCDRRGHSIAAI